MRLSLPFLKDFPDGHKAIAVRASVEANPTNVLAALELPPVSGLLMLSGGAGQMSDETFHQLADAFNSLGQALAQEHIAVIDGGTQSGAVALMGKALSQSHHTAPYIGILAAHAELQPGGPTGEDILEPHHSHYVLVDSQEWGAEVNLMYGIADCLSTKKPSIALLVNGGAISLKEVECNVQQGREIIVLAGSGRLADEIAAAALYPQQETRDRISAVVRDGHLTIFDLNNPVSDLIELIQQRLSAKRPVS